MLQHNKKTVRWTVFLYLRNVVISEYRSKRGDALFRGAYQLVLTVSTSVGRSGYTELDK